jgi:hypothetical protein
LELEEAGFQVGVGYLVMLELVEWARGRNSQDCEVIGEFFVAGDEEGFEGASCCWSICI